MPTTECDERILADLPQAAINGNIAEQKRKDHWLARRWEIPEIGPCRGLQTSGERGRPAGDEPGPVTLCLGVNGYHRISFITPYCKVRARLTGDRCFSECAPVFEFKDDPFKSPMETWGTVEEVFWREADLTGQDLVIDDREHTDLIAVRLIPSEPKHDLREVRWPMCISNDSGVHKQMKHRDPTDLFEWAARPPENGCVRLLLYTAGNGDACRHATQVGTQRGTLSPYVWGHANEWDLQNVQQYNNWGINTAKAMVDYAHDRGWEVYLFVRHRAPGPHELSELSFASQFWIDHPHYEILDAQGRPVSGLSVAFPEVREQMCRFYAELASFGADGVCVCYTRGSPPVLYEAPLVEGFLAKYGEDPRRLPDTDPRWLDFTADVVTQYMRALKQAVGPKCKCSAILHGNEALNRRFGLDVRTWIAERIVDDLFLMGHTYEKHGIHTDSSPDYMNYDYFQNLPGRQHVRLWPMFNPWQRFVADPSAHCGALQSYLDAGADGYGIWDATSWAISPEDKIANIWDLGKWPRTSYEKRSRLIRKLEPTSRDGYRYNRYSSIESG